VDPSNDRIDVINGAPNTLTTTLPVGGTPGSIAVNSVTNKIYATSDCGRCQGAVFVIDGATNNLSMISVGFSPDGIAVNPVTNKIYVANACGGSGCIGNTTPGSVTVIDGTTDHTTAIGVGFNPATVAVNSVTDKVYVLNFCGRGPCPTSPNGTVSVIDGVTNHTLTVDVGSIPTIPNGLGINSVTNRIYVASECGATCTSFGTLTVIDGRSNQPLPVAVGDIYPVYFAMAVDETSDRIYVPNAENTVSVIADGTALQFIPVSPCRVVDTRNANGPFGGPPIQGTTTRSFPIPESNCNVPGNAAAYSLNVTLVPNPGSRVRYLTIWPGGADRQPLSQTMSSPDGRIRANAATVASGVSGGVNVYVSDTTNVVIDISGYYVSKSNSTLAYYPLTPCRVVDTRDVSGDLGGPFLNGNQERDFPVLESTCIPSGLHPSAYSFNITAVPHPVGQRLGFLTVWPRGDPRPDVSTLNNLTGTIVANAAIVPAGGAGSIAVYPNDDTDLLIDIDGYFAPQSGEGLSLYPAVSCTLLDTRNGRGAFQGELTVNVATSTQCSPFTPAQAYIFNATVTPPTRLGFLTLWPDDQPRPATSTLNAIDGAITSNMAIVPTTDGSIDAYANDLTQLILDISGYFAP
jgi:DNA-binding beta-propeller fold protein YncE